VALKKTSGVLGDDLALNANQVAGVKANRELPVVWSVAKGSFVNKLILIPAAVLLSQFLPWSITPLLILGGGFLCYEGFEKVLHKLWHSKHTHSHLEGREAVTPSMSDAELRHLEQMKIRGAVRTDFILSAEIIVIALGVVETQPFLSQLLVLTAIGVAMTVGVYGLVAGIVKLDDVGLWMARFPGLARAIGQAILRAAPILMKFLSIAGTAAMFLVGGGILVHTIEVLHHWGENVVHAVSALPTWATAVGFQGGMGVVAGALVVGCVALFQQLRGSRHAVGK
jgi:hypothetical protein